MPTLSRLFRTDAANASGRLSLWVGLTLVLLAVLAGTLSRLSQRAAWEQQAGDYMAGDVPMMTTADAYYGMRLARMHADGRFVPGALAEPRHFTRTPMGSTDVWVPQWEPRWLPLLSRVIATAAQWSGSSIDRAAWLLPPLLSSLFIVPLFLAFQRLGVPAAGLLGGLVGTFCLQYYQRTGVGWSDTDSLNLFFPWALAATMLHMASEQRLLRLLAWSALAGAIEHAYTLWYWKPGLALGLALVMGLQLALAGAGWRRWVPCVGVFVLVSGPTQYGYAVASLVDFGEHYLWASRAAAAQPLAALRFPDVWSTISEIQPLTRRETLATIVPHAGLAALGLVAFGVWAVLRWRSLPALLPWMLLGAVALFGSRRFTLYLAPLVGAGWGLLVTWVVRLWMPQAPAPLAGDQPAPSPPTWRVALRHPAAQPIVAMLCSVAVFIAWLMPPADRLRAPAPAVPAPVFTSLKALAERTPEGARWWTWWDLGYLLVDTTGRGVYHDGAVQFTPQTNLVAASFVSADPEVMHSLVRFVDHAGNAGIVSEARQAADFPALLDRLRHAAPPATGRPVYVLFTPDMPAKFASLQTLATPLHPDGRRPRHFGIHRLTCSSLSERQLVCDGVTVDLVAGLVHRTGLPAGSGVPPEPLRRLVSVETGRVVREQQSPVAQGLTVQVLSDGKVLQGVYLLDETAYASNLNQMYLLGRYDASRFEQVDHRDAQVRAYRVLPALR